MDLGEAAGGRGGGEIVHPPHETVIFLQVRFGKFPVTIHCKVYNESTPPTEYVYPHT